MSWKKWVGAFCFVGSVVIPSPTVAGECVILLHGLARTDRSMNKLRKALEKAGYTTINVGYPSRSETVQELAAETIPKALARCPQGDTVHFVTHSMGGILVRAYLATNTIPRLGRVVMLAPPNRGSEIVDKLRNKPGYYWVNGPAGQQLGTDTNSLPLQLGPANFDVGIIAGSQAVNPILSAMLPKPNDGKVSVESTKLEGMKDHIVFPVTHSFMMWSPDVIHQVIYFLRHGVFDHSKIKKKAEQKPTENGEPQPSCSRPVGEG